MISNNSDPLYIYIYMGSCQYSFFQERRMLKNSWCRLMPRRKTKVWNDGFGKYRRVVRILVPYAKVSQNTLAPSFQTQASSAELLELLELELVVLELSLSDVAQARSFFLRPPCSGYPLPALPGWPCFKSAVLVLPYVLDGQVVAAGSFP